MVSLPWMNFLDLLLRRLNGAASAGFHLDLAVKVAVRHESRGVLIRPLTTALFSR
jgi:hypothetical protein